MHENLNSAATTTADPSRPAPAPIPAPPRRRRLWLLLSSVLLAIYAAMIWFDLPPPAGMKYAPPPQGAGQTAAHWWDKTQGLRGWSLFPEGWSWALLDPAPLPYWLVIIGLGLLGGAGLWVWERRITPPTRRQVAGALIALVVLGYALQLAALWLKPPAAGAPPSANQLLYNRIVDRVFTGFFNTAMRTDDPSLFFSRYADAIARTDEHRLCGHCRTHPPGPILFYWLPLQAMQALPAGAQQGLASALLGSIQIKPATMRSTDAGKPTNEVFTPADHVVAILAGQSILFGAALIVLPLYGLARRLAGPQHTLPLAALGLVLPGLVVMSPEFDQLYAVFAAALFYLAIRGLTARQGCAWWGLGAGLLLAFCLYWSFGLWVLGGLLGALAVAAVAGALGEWRPAGARPAALPLPAALRWGGGLLAGVAVPWLLLWLAGLDVPRVLQITSSVHLEGITTHRPYGPWLVFDLVDFLQSTGLLLVLTTLRVLVVRRTDKGPFSDPNPQSGAPARPRNPQLLRLGAWFDARWNLYGLLFWGSLLALDLAGVARAEVGRLWIFLMPLALLAVYRAVGRGQLGRTPIAALLAGQFVVLVLIAGRWLTP